MRLTAPSVGLLRVLVEQLPAAERPPVGATVTVVVEVARDNAELHTVSLDGKIVGEALGVDELVPLVRQQVEWAIAEHSPCFAFVHAGVVGLKRGVVVIPGVSGAGKTTLVRALLERGATYFSDEYAVVDGHGLVHPYVRPLHIKTADGLEIVDVARITDRVASAAMQVAAVVFVEYAAGLLEPQIKAVRGAEIALGLLEHAPAARRDPERLLDSFGAATTQVIGWRGSRGDAGPFADWLLDELGSV